MEKYLSSIRNVVKLEVVFGKVTCLYQLIGGNKFDAPVNDSIYKMIADLEKERLALEKKIGITNT